MPRAQGISHWLFLDSVVLVWNSCRVHVCWTLDWSTPGPTSFPKHLIILFSEFSIGSVKVCKCSLVSSNVSMTQTYGGARGGHINARQQKSMTFLLETRNDVMQSEKHSVPARQCWTVTDANKVFIDQIYMLESDKIETNTCHNGSGKVMFVFQLPHGRCKSFIYIIFPYNILAWASRSLQWVCTMKKNKDQFYLLLK